MDRPISLHLVDRKANRVLCRCAEIKNVSESRASRTELSKGHVQLWRSSEVSGAVRAAGHVACRIWWKAQPDGWKVLVCSGLWFLEAFVS
jgi:hypothetical protein